MLTLDLHAAQIQGFFDIPVDNLYASPIFAIDIRHNFANHKNITIVSPDVGGVSRARELAEKIDVDLAVVDKRRSAPGEINSMTIIGEVSGQTCILVDDICDTAGTLVKSAELLIEKGAKEVHAYITHGVLSGEAIERISKSNLSSMVITDTIEPTEVVSECPKIRIITAAPLLAHAMLNISNDCLLYTSDAADE